MAYKKLLVDNATCSRRFHITFDDRDEPEAQTALACPFCGVEIFRAENHPKVSLARQENLVQTAELSDNLVADCQLEDKFSQKSIPQLGQN